MKVRRRTARRAMQMRKYLVRRQFRIPYYFHPTFTDAVTIYELYFSLHRLDGRYRTTWTTLRDDGSVK